jgi:hypothetical protein
VVKHVAAPSDHPGQQVGATHKKQNRNEFEDHLKNASVKGQPAFWCESPSEIGNI